MFGGPSKAWSFLPRDKSDLTLSPRDWNTDAASSTSTLIGDPSNRKSPAFGSSVATLAIDTSGATRRDGVSAMSAVEGEGGKSLLELCQDGDEEALYNHCYENAGLIVQSVNVPMDNAGNTLMHLTVSMKDLGLTSMLLLKGADPNAPNKGGITPTIIAKRMKFTVLQALLIKHGGVVPAEEEKIGGGGGLLAGVNGNPHGEGRRKSGRKDLEGSKKRIASDLELLASDRSVDESRRTSQIGVPLSEVHAGSTDFGDLASTPGALDAPLQPAVVFPTHRLPIYDAAYLGLAGDQIASLPNSFLVAADDFGSTPLMKAAARGHITIVKALIARRVDINRADKYGNTALTWAAFGGQLICIKALTAVEGCLVDGYTPPPEGSTPLTAVEPTTPEEQQQREQEAMMLKSGMTPLVAASIAGHVAVVEHLLDCGASMDLKSGPGPTRSRTAVMYAAWMRREDVVRVLVRRGCSIDPDTEHWLKRGVIFLKRANLDYNVWTGSAGTFSKMVLAGGAPNPSKGRRMSLKDKMSYFSSEEHDALLALEAILSSGAGSSNVTCVSPGGALSRSVGNIFKSSASLFSLSETEASSSQALNDSNPLLAADGNSTRRERRASRPRARNRYRHGMNFDKLIGANPEVVAELTEQIPSRGTDLDALWVAVFQHVIQLLIAANQNKKAHFIIISAKAIHNAGEIIRAIETAEKQALMQGTAGIASSSVMLKPASPSSTNASSAATMFPALYVPHPEQNLFNGTKVRARMRELSKLVKNELPKQLMLTTRIAIGVWPPQHAMSDMIKAATDLARTCRELTDIANLSGMFHLVDRSLDVQFTAFEEDDEVSSSRTEDDGSDASSVTRTAIPASLTYEEYKRQNDLKVLEEITKQSSASRTAAHSANDEQGVVTMREQQQQQQQQQIHEQEVAADTAFFAKLDDLVRALVEVIKDIKKAFGNKAKAAYITASATAAHRAEVIIDEVRQYDLFAEFPEDLLFDEDDAAALASKGVTIGGGADEAFPILVADLWYATLTDVRQAARTVAMKGKLASGVMPPPTAAEDMVRATIPCLLAVKKLVTMAKESAVKIRRTSFDKVSKQEKWERDVAQNEHVKSLFLLWERQVLRPQQDGEEEATPEAGTARRSAGVAPSAEAEARTQEMELLRDDLDGLVLESAGNSKLVVRGGKLNKLVEWMTSHIHYDQEFTANMLLTHHSFTTTSELLDLLFRRYSLVAPPALSRSQYDTFLQRKIFPVKQRVCTVLKTWLELLFEDDFLGGNQHVAVFKLRDFCSEVVVKDSEVWGRELMRLVEQKLNRASNPQPAPAPPIPVGPTPKLPRLPPETDIQALLTNTLLYHDLDPLELARQLAILDQSHFARIKPHECLDQIWGEKRRKEMGLSKHADPSAVTGLGEMIRHTNVVTIWIANCIIRNEDLKARRDALRYFALMAVHCQELNNFNGITALNAAMSTAAVNRLHKTWDAFREKYPKLYEAYEDAAATVSPKGQYANYRKVLKDLAPPAVPFLGVSLTDLTFTELGNPDFLPETPALINFDKRRKVCQVLTNSIQKYQAVPYNLIPVSGIRDFLSNLGSLPLLNDDELYQMSLKVEPKEEELSDEEGGDEGG